MFTPQELCCAQAWDAERQDSRQDRAHGHRSAPNPGLGVSPAWIRAPHLGRSPSPPRPTCPHFPPSAQGTPGRLPPTQPPGPTSHQDPAL